METFVKVLIIFALWGAVRMLRDYLKKRGSKLAEEKPIYNYIVWGIYIVLGVGAIILIILSL